MLHAQIYADFNVSQGDDPLGTFRVRLEHEKAPRTCANFIGLATGRRPWVDQTTGAVRTNTPYYDGLTFHRLIHSFVIQGGSPNGQGTDGPGYVIQDEFHPDLKHSVPYVISMPKGGAPNTGGAQFFITLGNTPELDNKHSVFGIVTGDTTVIDGFESAADFPTGAGDKPLTDIVIDSVVISGPDYNSFDIDSPSLRLPHLSTTEVKITRDAVAQTMTATFDRKAQTEYSFLNSPDLVTWSAPWRIFSLDTAPGHPYILASRPESRYFLNMATVSYDHVPNAPADLNSTGKTIRIKFPGGTFLDIKPDGTGGGTWSQDSASGSLSSTSWSDGLSVTGIAEETLPQAFRLPLGTFSTTLEKYSPTGQDIQFLTWLSFHTEMTGWTEEKGGSRGNRFAFEILSN